MNVKQQRARQRKQEKHRRRRRDESRQGKYDPNDIRWIAAHEAGHAVAAVVHGIPLEFVEIRRRREPDGQISVGFTRTSLLTAWDAAGWGQEKVLPHVIQSMAGPAAEAQADPLYALKAGADALDRRETMRLGAIAICGVVEAADRYVVPPDSFNSHEDEIIALCIRAEESAALFVAENRAAIDAVAAALIQKTSLTGDEVAALVEATLAQEEKG